MPFTSVSNRVCESDIIKFRRTCGDGLPDKVVIKLLEDYGSKDAIALGLDKTSHSVTKKDNQVTEDVSRAKKPLEPIYMDSCYLTANSTTKIPCLIPLQAQNATSLSNDKYTSFSAKRRCADLPVSSPSCFSFNSSDCDSLLDIPSITQTDQSTLSPNISIMTIGTDSDENEVELASEQEGPQMLENSSDYSFNSKRLINLDNQLDLLSNTKQHSVSYREPLFEDVSLDFSINTGYNCSNLQLDELSSTDQDSQHCYDTQDPDSQWMSFDAVVSLEHWNRLYMCPGTVIDRKWRKKKKEDWHQEVIMVVDSSLQDTDFGASICDYMKKHHLFYRFEKLAQRNTVSWRRISKEQSVQIYTKQPTLENPSMHPVELYDVSLEHVVVVLKGSEFAEMIIEDECHLLKQIEKNCCRNVVSFLVLDFENARQNRNIHIQNLTIRSLNIQLSKRINSIVCFAQCDYEGAADMLAKMTRSFAHRPYRYPKQDGAFVSQCLVSPHSKSSHKGSREIWIQALKDVGLTTDQATAVANVYPSVRALMDAFEEPMLSVESKKDLLMRVVCGGKKKAVRQEVSGALFEYCSRCNITEPYVPLIRLKARRDVR